MHDNGIDLDPAVGEKDGRARWPRQYETALFGKAHFSTYHTYEPTGTPECLRSSAQYDDTWYGPYGVSARRDDAGRPQLVGARKAPAGQHYERFYHMDGRGDERTKLMWENAGDTKGAAQVWHSRLPLAYHNTPWTADRAIEWIKHGRDTDKPFCTWVSFPDPHHPFDCPEPWSWLHKPEDVDLPPNRTRNYEGKPWWHKAAMEGEPADPKFAEVRKAYSRIQPQTDDQLREIIANTYGQIAFIDHQVGRMMTALQEAGLDENTIVIYISDHGDWLGDHGLILKGPMHYEGLLRVPMIVRGPNVRAGAVVDKPISTLTLDRRSMTTARPRRSRHSMVRHYAPCSRLMMQHGTLP